MLVLIGFRTATQDCCTVAVTPLDLPASSRVLGRYSGTRADNTLSDLICAIKNIKCRISILALVFRETNKGQDRRAEHSPRYLVVVVVDCIPSNAVL